MKIVLCPTAPLAAEAVAANGKPLASVEAEYGSTVVEGQVVTLAHHQKEGAFATPRPAPCCAAVSPLTTSEGWVLVSHLDLDTIGGVLAVLGNKPTAPAFWQAAQEVDLRGPHRLAQITEGQPEVARQLRAYWAWSQTRPRQARDAATDVTAEVEVAAETLAAILGSDPALLAAGDDFAAAEQALNKETFVSCPGAGVIMRRAKKERQFCNHLYTTPNGDVEAAVVALSLEGVITVSLAEPIPGVSCRDIVQGLWGPEAGGHAGIAGSPRARIMTEAEWSQAGAVVAQAIWRHRWGSDIPGAGLEHGGTPCKSPTMLMMGWYDK